MHVAWRAPRKPLGSIVKAQGTLLRHHKDVFQTYPQSCYLKEYPGSEWISTAVTLRRNCHAYGARSIHTFKLYGPEH